MFDEPYTESDLRAEAARQHSSLTEDPEFMCVGEAMEDSEVESLLPPAEADGAEGHTWGTLLPYNHDDGNAYNKAQRKIHDLIGGAADTSEWAVELGADNLRPESQHVTVANSAGEYVARVHFAFGADVPDAKKNALISLIAAVLDGQGD